MGPERLNLFFQIVNVVEVGRFLKVSVTESLFRFTCHYNGQFYFSSETLSNNSGIFLKSNTDYRSLLFWRLLQFPQKGTVVLRIGYGLFHRSSLSRHHAEISFPTLLLNYVSFGFKKKKRNIVESYFPCLYQVGCRSCGTR